MFKETVQLVRLFMSLSRFVLSYTKVKFISNFCTMITNVHTVITDFRTLLGLLKIGSTEFDQSQSIMLSLYVLFIRLQHSFGNYTLFKIPPITIPNRSYFMCSISFLIFLLSLVCLSAGFTNSIENYLARMVSSRLWTCSKAPIFVHGMRFNCPRCTLL